MPFAVNPTGQQALISLLIFIKKYDIIYIESENDIKNAKGLMFQCLLILLKKIRNNINKLMSLDERKR